jgi:deazaflavin-dependent oxidoreductase (nitroreductase family)
MCEPRILVCDPNHMSDQRWRKQVSAILNSRLKPIASPVPAGRHIPIDTHSRDYRVRETHEMKHRIVHTLQKFLLNPPIKLALAIGLPLPGYALLETTGRKTGKPRRTPVGDGRIGNQFWLVAEHGMKAGYVRNIERDPRVRMKLRQGLKYHWHTGTAHLLYDDDPRERQRWLATQLPSSAGNARAVRLFGTQLLTVRIDLND